MLPAPLPIEFLEAAAPDVRTLLLCTVEFYAPEAPPVTPLASVRTTARKR